MSTTGLEKQGNISVADSRNLKRSWFTERKRLSTFVLQDVMRSPTLADKVKFAKSRFIQRKQSLAFVVRNVV